MTDLIAASRGCPSGKRQFKDRKTARRWIRSRNHFAGQKARAYRCRSCDNWHVTTEATARTTYFRERDADDR